MIKNNSFQSGFAHIAAMVLAVVIIIVGFVGWKVWDFSRKTEPNSNQSSNESVAAPNNKFLEISEWKVRIPASEVGKYSAVLSPDTASVGPMSPDGLEEKSVLVNGFTKDDNKCLLPFEATKIYRHKEEDPDIRYTTTFKLSTVAPTNVKVGDWWYSLQTPITKGDCFSESVPSDYQKLSELLVSNFKKLQTY